ncbi:MAG: DUF2779 domain-containing protein, partial [Deltaproteobacteria bacterium]
VDILERLGNGRWNMIEVKSSTSEKEIHLPDVAVQYYVLKGSGLEINQVILMHLNNQYVYDGNHLDLEKLFSQADLSQKALIYMKQVPVLISSLNDMLAKPEEPAIRPGRHCKNPYECEFLEHCTKDMPEHWVMNLSGITQKKLNDLAALGIEDIGDIPASFPLTALQQRIRSCVVNNKEYVSADLKKQLEGMVHPVHFLDFETLSLGIPRYCGTRPYQAIPFQWSDHILRKDGSVAHQEYLCSENRDPREELTAALLEALGTKGSIVTYTNYEESVIRKLVEELPHHRERLLATLSRIKDLHKIISKHYYHPGFHGSFSLKSVAPALLPEMSYENLDVHEGEQASLEYLRMIDPATPPEEKERIKQALLAYCGQDTLAMVNIREDLRKKF